MIFCIYSFLKYQSSFFFEAKGLDIRFQDFVQGLWQLVWTYAMGVARRQILSERSKIRWGAPKAPADVTADGRDRRVSRPSILCGEMSFGNNTFCTAHYKRHSLRDCGVCTQLLVRSAHIASLGVRLWDAAPFSSAWRDFQSPIFSYLLSEDASCTPRFGRSWGAEMCSKKVKSKRNHRLGLRRAYPA